MARVIEAIVLAAGRGLRMGQPKHLLPVEGVPMLLCVVRALEAAPVAGIAVALRRGDRAAGALLESTRARPAWVDDLEEGRAASIRAGLGAAAKLADGYLFALADQPWLEPQDFRALVEALDPLDPAIVHARYDGQRGSPVLFPARYRPELLALRGREGGRSVLARYADRVRAVDLDPVRGRDVDRPGDLPEQR